MVHYTVHFRVVSYSRTKTGEGQEVDTDFKDKTLTFSTSSSSQQPFGLGTMSQTFQRHAGGL